MPGPGALFMIDPFLHLDSFRSKLAIIIFRVLVIIYLHLYVVVTKFNFDIDRTGVRHDLHGHHTVLPLIMATLFNNSVSSRRARMEVEKLL